MSTPEQEQALATISSLATSLRTQALSDVQIDLLEVAAHLMTNIAVQSTINCASTRLIELEYQIGEPVQIDLAALGFTAAEGAWQRTTVTGKQNVSIDEAHPEYQYQTAFSGTDRWLYPVECMRKVEK